MNFILSFAEHRLKRQALSKMSGSEMIVKAKGALTRAELREAVYKAMPQLSRQQASKVLDEFFEEILKTLENNEGVKLRGFGHFKLQHKRQRIGRNPKTGEEAVITPRRVAKFAPSPQLTAKLNNEIYSGDSED